MLLVEPPTAQDLRRVIEGLMSGELAREAVQSWYEGVFAKCGWDIPIDVRDGYWYFYSLKFVTTSFPPDHFLREQDFAEYLDDLNREPGSQLQGNLWHLRTHQVDPEEIRWPLALIHDDRDVMGQLPSSRGTFERRMDMVEHCHLRFHGCSYLFVKQFDERASEAMVLGTSRDRQTLERLLQLLEIDGYMLP